MRYTICRLDEESRGQLEAHFLALSAIDRHRRFGKAVGREVIAAYVDRIDLRDDAVFGARDAECAIVGVMHLAMDGDDAELGLSVLGGHRRRGVGLSLVNRALSHARNRSVARIVMYSSADNVPVLGLAHKLGMDVTLHRGEVIARLDLPPSSSTTPLAYALAA